MRILLLALALFSAAPAWAGPADPADLRTLELTPGDRESLTAAGFRLAGGSGGLAHPDGRPVVESELAGLLKDLRAERLRAASIRLLELHGLHRQRGSFTREEAAEVRRLLSANADVLPADVQRDFWELAPPAGEGAKALAAGADGLQRAAGAAGGEDAAAAADRAFGGAARQGAPAGVFVAQDARGQTGAFTDPDEAFVAEMSGRIDRMDYDPEVKRLLKVVAANAYREDTRTAIEAAEKHKPRIVIGDADAPGAWGWTKWADGKPQVTVDDKEILIESQSEGGAKGQKVTFQTLTGWNEHEPFLTWFGVVPEVRALHGGEPAWTDQSGEGRLLVYKGRQGYSAVNEFDDETKAQILLHELVHVATAGEEATDPSLVTEMRSYLAEYRMVYRMRRPGGKRYQAFLKSPREMEKVLVAGYADTFKLADMREDAIAERRRELQRKLKLDETALEEAHWTDRKAVIVSHCDQMRDLAKDLYDREALTQRDHKKATLRIQEMEDKILEEVRGSEKFRGEDYRQVLNDRLRRVELSQALYERLLEEDAQWRKQRSR